MFYIYLKFFYSWNQLKLLFFGLILCFYSGNLFSQCSNNPPATDNCETAPIICSYDELDGYCFTLTQNFTYNYPQPYCINPPMSPLSYPNWIAFYAECTTLNMRLTASNCDSYMSYRMA